MNVQRFLSRALSQIYGTRDLINSEYTFIRNALQRVQAGAEPRRLLDIGCGFGRFADTVRATNFEYVGADINPEVVQACRDRGLDVRLPGDFQAGEAFDAMLLAHIVEHFAHQELVAFLNRWAPQLRIGGTLIVLTPLYHDGFFDDFDHVKPYNPGALRQILCASTRQTQPIGIHARFQEDRLWIKRDPFLHFHRDARWTHLVKVPMSLLSAASLGMLGQTTGYGMSFQRIA